MLSADPTSPPALETPAARAPGRLRSALRGGLVRLALVLLAMIVLAAAIAPLLATADPTSIDPASRLQAASAAHPMGTDALGRDVYSRVLHGARVSLAIGTGVALASIALGFAIGLVAGYVRWADAVLMRVMDGLMAIPGILLAIALVSFLGGGLMTVIAAIAIPETPRVVRLVRSVILSVRNEPYVEAAISLGTRAPTVLLRHLAPSTIAPLTVQGTFILASAMLTEAAMSFLGVGLPAEVPSWGNIMAEGRAYFQLRPGLILFAGTFLSLTVLSINILGDVARDALDPKMAGRI